MKADSRFPHPANFPYDNPFYFDEEVAMMLGNYKKSPAQSVGLRWMIAESDLGFPSNRGKGMWMVVPDKLALYILEGIDQNMEQERPSIVNKRGFIEALHCLRTKVKESTDSTIPKSPSL